ncbi:hypothetical protein MASR1M45_15560 [Candidatus Kapaibacterium sp.]
MSENNNQREIYYSLFGSSTLHYIILILLIGSISFTLFHSTLPIIKETLIEGYLEGLALDSPLSEDKERIKYLDKLVNDNRQNPTKVRDIIFYYTNWQVIIYKDSEQEGIYWFNPLMSLSMPILLISVLFSLLIASIIPSKIGMMSHKIEREILNTLDILYYKINNKYSDNIKEFEDLIISMDIRELLSRADEWKISHDDLIYLRDALKWKNSGVTAKIINSLSAIKFYLRFYFTDKYSNVILGLVYIGAAVLIIIIGLRGLKFIPASQPSLVFFALGLEFTVLITYAFTVIYSRSDNDTLFNTATPKSESLPLLSEEFGNSREVESLLRAFLKKK